jgi:mono/diheme cytochrome c family protein
MKIMMGMMVCGLLGGVVAYGGSFKGVQAPQKPAEDQEKPAEENVVPAKAGGDVAKLANPVKATAESVAAGKKSYGMDCAMCHGKEGAGDGDLVSAMKLKLKDYRDPTSLKGMSDGQIYTIILNGKGQMTGEEGRLREHQIWNLVNYVRSLAKSKT